MATLYFPLPYNPASVQSIVFALVAPMETGLGSDSLGQCDVLHAITTRKHVAPFVRPTAGSQCGIRYMISVVFQLGEHI